MTKIRYRSSLNPTKKHVLELRDPRWKARRLEILARDNSRCQLCGVGQHSGLHVHHLRYGIGLTAWGHPDADLLTLCDFCHGGLHTLKAMTRKEFFQLKPMLLDLIPATRRSAP